MEDFSGAPRVPSDATREETGRAREDALPDADGAPSRKGGGLVSPEPSAAAADFADDLAAVAALDIVPRVLDVVCRVTGMRFSAVARVTETRWIACASRDGLDFGLGPGDELEIGTTFCQDVRESRKPIVIDDVAADPLYCDHAVPAKYGFRSYISVPITTPDGAFFGTLCALDPKPADLTGAGAFEMFGLFAEMIGQHLHSQERLAASERALVDERRLAELREQFVAILGHDLRNPLAAVDAGVKLLRRRPGEESFGRTLDLMERSLQRMGGLIGDVLDLAQIRLGAGLAISRTEGRTLPATIRQIVDEARSAHPDRDLRLEMEVEPPIFCDEARIGQLTSNLVSNALEHGAPDQPVVVRARTREGAFVLSVMNRGAVIPPGTMRHLFEPFVRGRGEGRSGGLGLGLYIGAQIARAHGGELRIASDAQRTLFTFEMPNRA